MFASDYTRGKSEMFSLHPFRPSQLLVINDILPGLGRFVLIPTGDQINLLVTDQNDKSLPAHSNRLASETPWTFR